MIALIQRVTQAKVEVEGQIVGQIAKGLLVLLGVEKEEIAASLDAIQDPVSLQEPVYNDGTENIFVMDQVKDTKNNDENWAETMTINEALKRLNDKEKNIIIRRYFDGKTQMEIASEIGISQAQVSRLEKGALERMRREL